MFCVQKINIFDVVVGLRKCKQVTQNIAQITELQNKYNFITSFKLKGKIAISKGFKRRVVLLTL